MDDAPDAHGVGSGYAAAMLAKAFFTYESHSDPAVRERAAARVSRWSQVLAQSLTGAAAYGSSTPLPGIPDWVTLDVATGGFATGALLAGGPLAAFERELAAGLPGIGAGSERRDLNAYFLSEAGIAQLQDRISRGDYRIDVPEAAALPMAAWLLGRGHAQAARELVSVLVPFFDRLRFYPAPKSGHEGTGVELHVSTAGEVAARLSALPPQPRIAAQQAAVFGLLPRYDQAVALFLETVEDGWPCRRYPPDWTRRAQALVDQLDSAQVDGQTAVGTSRRHRHKRELFDLLARCAHAPDALEGRQVGRIRRIVDDFVAAHGAPGSAAHRALRERQRRDVAAVGFHDIAPLVAGRLQAYPASAGVPDLGPVLAPLDAREAGSLGLPAGTEVPAPLARRARRCQSGTIEQLVEQGLITSGDSLATLTPRITSALQTGGFDDPDLRALYGACYQAFRRRRSLLLLNLERQASFGGLPWVAAVEGLRQPARADAEAARASLTGIAGLALASFPHAPLPNKLLQELQALAQRAQWDLPLVDELAADIFMGRFGPKFLDAARCAATLLEDSLYANYFAIDARAILALPSPRESRGTQAQADAFGLLCAARAGVQPGLGQPAVNGMVIEQQQILTTQNLAVLVAHAGVDAMLADRYGQMALASFEWICARQQMKINDWHARLRMIRNTAYAWRQALFFLSLLPPAEQAAAIAAMEAHLRAQGAAFQSRFRPVMQGLQQAARGERLPQHDATARGGRVFTGWSNTRHWLLHDAG
ncbi:hypothetical protein ABE485_25565 [Achromobacter spanius]|uniref:hypothetical protein n=1 Tax=Achromobacter spanius TaxID=217203 RepID=UPI003208C2C9